MADTTKKDEKKVDTSALQNEIRNLESEIGSLQNKVNALNGLLQQIGSCKYMWDVQKQTYKYNPYFSSASLLNKFEGNSQKTSKKMFNNACTKMDINYSRADNVSKELNNQIAVLRGVISQKNRELSNKYAELRGYI